MALVIIIVVLIVVLWYFSNNDEKIRKEINKTTSAVDGYDHQLRDRINQLYRQIPKNRLTPDDNLTIGINNLMAVGGDIDEGFITEPPNDEIGLEAFIDALDAVVNHPVPEQLHITDRIINIGRNPDIDVNINMAVARAEQQQKTLINTPPKNIAKSPEEQVRKFEEKQVNKSDSQNVHDSIIYKQVNRFYNQLVDMNANQQPITFREIKRKLLGISSNMQEKTKARVTKILDRLERGYKIPGFKIKESDVLIETWKRIHSDDNKHNRQTLYENLINNLVDCNTKSGDLVCGSGRTPRILSVFAHADATDPNLGVFKNSDTTRNALYMKAGKIVEEEIGKLSADDKKTYYNDGTNESIATARESITKQIENEIENTELDSVQKTAILNDIKSGY